MLNFWSKVSTYAGRRELLFIFNPKLIYLVSNQRHLGFGGPFGRGLLL
jgi:hypothetical protein